MTDDSPFANLDNGPETREAEYWTRCAACDGAIEPGDTIAFSSLDEEWVHEECA